MYPICPNNSKITPWGCIKDLTCTPLKWWCGNLCTWSNSTQESWQYRKMWAWLKDSIKAPLENRDKMKSNHQPDVYLITRDDHANPWRSTNLDRKGEYAPIWHRMCDRSKRSNHIKSSIINYAILVTWIYNWIIPTDLRCTSRMKKHDGI